ncbi:MAG: GNAT family N-acetyltransferase [Flavobacteriaceae bacterium]|jgi:putative acetyltransferase|nr:GNAT family N-acetyltransferase [Flavobacteriaceae bacterium]
MIVKVGRKEYAQLLEIWDSAVRHTHDFLLEEDFLYFKENMMIYFEHVNLLGYRNEEGELVGFVGISEDMVEMLFIHQEARGKGVGKILLKHVIDNNNITLVDVNEQNKQAVGFYEHMGFRVQSRDSKDSQGKDYPILHMKLIREEV